MRFKLVEDWDVQLDESKLLEKTKAETEIVKIAADLANCDKPLYGYISHMNSTDLQALESYCKDKDIDFENVRTNWEAHHISGIHPSSKKHPDGQLNNVALLDKSLEVKGKSLHQLVTDQNKSHYVNLLTNIQLSTHEDINALMLRIVAKCIANNIDANDVLVMKQDPTELIKLAIQDNINSFDWIAEKYPKHIIYLKDIIEYRSKNS